MAITDVMLYTQMILQRKDWYSLNKEELQGVFNNTNKNPIAGHPTGFPELDRQTNGLVNGSLILIGARPGMGKTSLALDIAQGFAQHTGKTPVYFSFADGSKLIAARLLQKQGVLTCRELYTSETAAQAAQLCVDYLKSAPIRVCDAPHLTVSQMKEIGRNTKDLGLIVVDYLQLISRRDSSWSIDISALNEISMDLKLMAKELNVPVICTTQLPRNIDYRNDKRPILEDLRSQGSIINDSDLILFLYRDSYYNPSSPTGMTTECIIAKNRYGNLETVLLDFDPNHVKFT